MPIDSEIRTETTPASSDARAPNITRDATSRPISSVPNQCSRLGGLRIAPQLVASGSYGATSGANNASATKRAMTASPNAAKRRRNNRRTGWVRGAAVGATCGSVLAIVAIKGPLNGSRTVATAAFRDGMPYLPTEAASDVYRAYTSESATK